MFGVCSVARATSGFDAAIATDDLGLDLYRRFADQAGGENVLLSPYSIEGALGMAYVGAEGLTREEMARVLHFSPDDAAVTAAFSGLRSVLGEVVQDSEIRSKQFGGDPIEFHEANRLFAQQGFPFRDSFLIRLKDDYKSPFEPLDFEKQAERSRSTINSWVEEQTHGRIRDLISEGGVAPSTRLVLANALYLKAPWDEAFNSELTGLSRFLVNGSAVRNVPTMYGSGYFGYTRGDGFTAVAVRYRGGELEFLILLPDKPTDVDALGARLTSQMLRSCARDNEELRLYLPKFRIEGGSMELSKEFQALGMKSAFDQPPGSANFDRIAPRLPNDYLALSKVFHKTFLSLDENGTAAAAATAVVFQEAGAAYRAPHEPIEVHVDHPFVFAIRLRSSGLCLFLGRVTDPEQAR
jgi:serpin B